MTSALVFGVYNHPRSIKWEFKKHSDTSMETFEWKDLHEMKNKMPAAKVLSNLSKEE